MSKKDKGNQRLSAKEMDAKKPKSSKQAKEERRAKKLAKEAKRGI